MDLIEIEIDLIRQLVELKQSLCAVQLEKDQAIALLFSFKPDDFFNCSSRTFLLDSVYRRLVLIYRISKLSNKEIELAKKITVKRFLIEKVEQKTTRMFRLLIDNHFENGKLTKQDLIYSCMEDFTDLVDEYDEYCAELKKYSDELTKSGMLYDYINPESENNKKNPLKYYFDILEERYKKDAKDSDPVKEFF